MHALAALAPAALTPAVAVAVMTGPGCPMAPEKI